MRRQMIPELVLRKAEELLKSYCASSTGRLACPHVELTYKLSQDAVTLFFRDGCKVPQPIARFRYSVDLCQWLLFIPGGPVDWRPCLDVPPTLNFETLLRYLDEDPFKLFWPTTFTCFT